MTASDMDYQTTTGNNMASSSSGFTLTGLVGGVGCMVLMLMCCCCMLAILPFLWFTGDFFMKAMGLY